MIITVMGIVGVIFFGICMIGILIAICGLPITAVYGIYLIITNQPLVSSNLFFISLFSGVILIIIGELLDYVKNKV